MTEASNSDVRVLVVEDDDDCRLVVIECLKVFKSFQSTGARNGAEALEALASADFDVILLDLFMPVMDGFQFLLKYTGEIPIIVLSAWADMKVLPREPYASLIKPFDIKELKPLLHSAAQKRRAA